VTSFLFGPKIPLSTLFSNTLSLSLESEAVKYGHESCGAWTSEWLR
jgi:hypothetical protein